MTGNVASSDLLMRVQQRIGQDLAKVEEVFAAELASSNPFATDVLAHVCRFRGKRLRPILVLLTARCLGGIRPEHHVLAAVVEMIHMATLVHDDVLDEAATRRHVATVNARWNNETSVLFGDCLFTHAFHLASSLPTTEACRMIGWSTNRVCEGELTQVRERGNFDLDEAAYFEIIEGKTAELCALSCRLGARYAEAEAATVEEMAEFGRLLGLAFQIADDLLDLTGDEHAAGKSLGSDLSLEKMTLPLIRLMSEASSDEAARIRQLLAAPDEASRQALRTLLEEGDAFAYTRDRALALVSQSCELLDRLPPSPDRQLLQDMARFAVERTH
ncbi:MAG: polyprenyl synthetase family protein [Planctomycetaceae bacterium]|nr:polyprenyl synthetase family protein [Planctomycetaceae bacterium]